MLVVVAVAAWLLVWSSPGLAATSPGELRFQHPIYNVTIPENSVGKVYAKQPPGEDTLGLQIDPDTNLEVRYKIINGDKNKFFKAEEHHVGDFCFLSIRTRTGNTDVLNRERKDKYTLEVRASASKRDGKNKILMEADTTVVVRILDTNDLSPLFYPTEYSITIAEDTPLHRSIIKVTAEDADLGLNGEIYYSFLEETDQFAIHPTSGVVTITRPLTLNERSYHEIVVLGKDRGALFQTSGTSHAARAMLTIKVKQVNLYSPEIYVHHFTDIVENVHPEIYAIVRVADKDEGVHGQIKSLDIVNGDPDGHFRIQATEKPGEFNIVVHSLLDREKTPQGYNLTLRAIDRGTPPKQSYKSVPVHLTDFNDNAPVFHKEIYEVNVPETAPINTPVIRLKVTDIDLGKNAQVFLEIVGGNEGSEFYVNPTTGMLYTAAILDAETKAFYTLTVSAIDQGNIGTRKQSSAKVKINVLDTNDNDPLFEKSEVTVYLDENEPAGTSVTKVTARDKDSGENAYISYSIANLNPVPFEIDHFSGIVKTTVVLDYESSRREYVLRVRASDWGLPYRRQTEMQLTIKIRDINDNRPQFDKIDCLGHVSRYLPISSEIITLTAIDLDARSIISYSIISGNDDGCFNIDSLTGTLAVACDLKEIKADERELNITASDGSHFSDTLKVHIHLVHSKKALSSLGRLVTDEKGMFQCKETGAAGRLAEVVASAEKNNAQGGHEASQEEFAMMPSRYGENVHSPEFYDFPLEIKVNESVALGTTLTRIKARDRDLGYNGKLIFGISGGDQDSVFRIDPETGDLKVIGYLDREREYQYIINISVYDLGKPQKGVSRLLPITVLDVNDNPPKFIKTLGTYRIIESASNGTVVCKLNATDADSGEFSKIKYFLVTDTDDFAVDTLSGVVSVSNNLDRERQSMYELKVRAKDSGGLYSEALVMINVDDVNDNSPQFGLTAFNVKVREDVPKGTVVSIVNADDPDLGNGGKVKYSILDDGELDDSFKIDALTGTLRTRKILDFEERQIHQLTIRAMDGGSPPLFSDVAVTIEIIDVNENIHPPTFEDFVLEGSVKENQPVGTKVFTVRATDADPPGMDSRITYSIRGGDGMGYFTINNEGEIRTLTVLDAETRPYYWLTICAQDQGIVPLHSCVKVYIEIEDENDCVPLTLESSYSGHISENSPGGRFVLQVQAEDADRKPTKIFYKILPGESSSMFHINSTTGVISTANRLDRENRSEHWLSVHVSDDGTPQLSSITHVIVYVTDVNDHAPVFLEQPYWVKVPAGKRRSNFQAKLKENQIESENGDEAREETIIWEAYNGDIKGTPVFRVFAHDADEGINGEITYSAKSGKSKAAFHINPETGVVFYNGDLTPENIYEFNVRASDNGIPPKITTIKLSIEAVNLPDSTTSPPHVKNNILTAKVTESDKIGHLVSQVQAYDDDNDTLWYEIIEGDNQNHFFIGRETGNIILAKKVYWEKQRYFNLNISVTDGFHVEYVKLGIVIINDLIEDGPSFSQNIFVVNVSENYAGGSPILSLRTIEQDNLLYSIYNARNPPSLNIFKIDTTSGDLSIKRPLDRETTEEHYLTVQVRHQTLKSKSSFARVLIRVYDHNDHAPEFNTKIIQGKVFETSPIGTSIVKIQASDRDKGENAVIIYSISSGNLGNIFSIDPYMGDIILSLELDLDVAFEYMLQIRASNPGPNPLSTVIPIHIMVTMADDAKPRFSKSVYSVEIYENEPRGTFVEHIEARSTSTIIFEITNGNIEDAFDINPSTGIITSTYSLDYEKIHLYNLTITATNMLNKVAECFIIIHIIDKNDNPPRFLSHKFEGSILESAPISSLVFYNSSTKLIITVEDLDSGVNSLKSFEIIENIAKKYFFIDSTTGAIKTIKLLDFETIDIFRFHVRVYDLGKPTLCSETTAEIVIKVIDVNDCPPKFDLLEYNVTLQLPTYKNIAVLMLTATDGDKNQKESLKYDIIDGDRKNVFAIDPLTGMLIVLQPEKIKQFHKLHVRVSDGKFSSIAPVHISVEKSENVHFKFQKPYYEGSVMENSTKIVTVTVVNVLGNVLNEHVEFNILNPTDMFTIGSTSGAIQTNGVKFDREIKDNYFLIIEAKISPQNSDKNHKYYNIAHTVVNVTVMDVNDNCPIFMDLPYYAIVSVDDQKGQVVAKVHAEDLDSFENGEVRYEMKRGHGELFKVCRKSGEISLKQNLEGHNKEYQLIIGAYDGGVTPCYSEITVNVKVVDKSMPVFDKQFYSIIVPENIEIMTSLGISLHASSPMKRKLIYTIVNGNEDEKFSLDFNTGPDNFDNPCIIFATEELDYETQQIHHLTIRATDSVTNIHAEVTVSVIIEDVNDNPPEFSLDSYFVSISEASSYGALLTKLGAHDNDTGINQELTYSIITTNENISSFFRIDSLNGNIFLNTILDREEQEQHHFIVTVSDKGLPTLSTTAHVWVTVLDVNDNPPSIEQPTHNIYISEHAKRGQFVTKILASDPDIIDQGHLSYSIVGGNDKQAFSINNTNGIISITNIEKLGKYHQSVLNISVTDGIYTTFTRSKILLQPANKFAPRFSHSILEVTIAENKPPGTFVVMVVAEDEDFGEYGTLSYSIPSNKLKEKFQINTQTGELTTVVKLDRELNKEFEIPIMVVDGGGKLAFTLIRVKISDENDNKPQFIYNEYKISVYLNQSLTGSFLNIKATDLDEGVNGEIRYSIYSKNDQMANLFGINAVTGAISLLDDSNSWESQIFQFWVRATDNGVNPLYSDIPIEVYIMSMFDEVPVFETIPEKYFILENSPQGTVITRLKMSSQMPVTFKILPAIFDSSLFTIDNTGQLILSGTIDREITDLYIIGILAETKNIPALIGFTEITLSVIDENDNAPVFHTSPIFLNLAENIEQGSTIIKVIAEDIDFGSNGEIRYALANDMGDVGNIFTIDPFTGWIMTLVDLDRENQPLYKFQVLAIDNSHQKHVNRTTVIIRLKDYNDCPPIFTQEVYHASVLENARIGTSVIQLDITDEDIDITPVDFYITSGDNLCQFHIKQTGEVYLLKSLDRESISQYTLQVIVTDGKHFTSSVLNIDVLDINDNPPNCVHNAYHKTIMENIAIGSNILTIEAIDADQEQNAQFKYFLTGFKSDHFQIDKQNGQIKTVSILDRENQLKYHLFAHVQDKNNSLWECVSEVFITLSDANDNAPQFSISRYSITLPEDVEIGTLVIKVHATDKDAGINRAIRYSLVDNIHQQFAITPESGIITLLTPLDRETQSVFNFNVQARDLGNPSLWSKASIQLTVSDVNDNPPVFRSKNYHITLRETAAVGTETIKVSATSKDTGINADIFYSIINGNDQKKFSIDSKTGMISTVDSLDYERTKEYILTIQAMDRGLPPLSNIASVNITIVDENDNSPVFTQNSYKAFIKEDSILTKEVIQVMANDVDSGSNGKVFYSIEKGNSEKVFTINSGSGQISLMSMLDREKKSNYVLEICARDNGVPSLSSFVIVNIEVTDANDNAPFFTKANYSFILQEDKPIGFLITKFEINDADIYPNAAPYVFDIRSGNEDFFFNLEQDGYLKTAAKFNQKSKNQYVLQIRVFDNGSPSLYSDAWVTIKIIEESQYPPIISSQEIFVNSFSEEFQGGEIGKIYVFDQDPYDILMFDLASNQISPIQNLFKIDEKNGTIYALPQLDVGEYKLNISVSDGKFESFGIIKIYVEIVNEDMLKNAVVIRFREVTAKSFISNHRKGFIRTVRNALNCHTKDIIIISIQSSSDDANQIHHKEKRSFFGQANNTSILNYRKSRRIVSRDLDVLFCVKKSSNPTSTFFTSESIRKLLNINLEELEESTKLVVEEMIKIKCTAHYCAYGDCQERFILDTTKINPISTDAITLVCPFHQHKTECKCHDGYGGEQCETIVNECSRKPCLENEKCIPDQSIQGYNCQCIDKLEEGKCHLDPFKCHSGNCFRPLNPIYFNGKSYIQYKIGKELFNGKRFFEDIFVMTLKIKTHYPSGCLMSAFGRIDFNILEISNSVIQYRIELGSGEGVIRVSSVKISDGKWHEVKLERDGSSARLTVDGKHVAHGFAPGINGLLNLNSDDLFFGAEVTQHPAILGMEDIRHGFVGCLGDIFISNELVPLHNGGVGGSLALKKLANVEFKCPSILVVPGVCGSFPCLNGGTCIDLLKPDSDRSYECKCHTRYVGSQCEVDTDPCASQPCLYGGICTSTLNGNYECTCSKNLKGKRCELGRWCEKPTCYHGGLCEEGDMGPACRCHGYHGPLCEFDIDECKGDPCLNGATCINEPGSFRCVCPPDKTGMHCGNPLHSDAVKSSVYELIGRDKLLWIMGLIGSTCLLILICSVILSCYKKHAEILPPESKSNVIHSSLKQNEMTIIKRGSKLSTLENQRSIMSEERSLQYTSICTPDAIRSSHSILNNMDILRTYGSGENLECSTPSLKKKIKNENLEGSGSHIIKPRKVSWAEQPSVQSFTESKTINDMSGKYETNEDIIEPPKAYQWNPSDWRSPDIDSTLTNIVEHPGIENADSSSYKSDDSTENKKDIKLSNSNIYAEKIRDNENFSNDTNEKYLAFPGTCHSPYTYSPNFESEKDDQVEYDDNGVESYGFPSARRRQYLDDNTGSIITILEERSILPVTNSNVENSENVYSTLKKNRRKMSSSHDTQV